MLPCSYEQAESPAILISNRSMAPAFPQMNDPRVNHVLPDISLHLANTAVVESGANSARMFCFNMISKNNWTNEHFSEVFHLAVNHLLIKMSETACTAQSMYMTSAEHALTLYTSKLVFDFPELQAVLSDRALEGARYNVGLLHNLNMEINKMNQGGYRGPEPMYVTPNAYPNQLTGMTPPPPGYVWVIDPNSGQYILIPAQYQSPMQSGYMRPGMQPGMVNQGMPMQPGQTTYMNQSRPTARLPMSVATTGPDLDLTRDFGQTTRSVNQNQNSSGRFSESINLESNSSRESYMEVGRGSGISQSGHFNRHLGETYEPEVIPTQRETYESSHTTLDNGDDKMDRTKHETGLLTGVTTLEEQTRVEDIKAAAENIQIELANDVIVAETSLDSAIAQLRVDSAKDNTISRQYFMVPKILVSTIDTQTQLNNWFVGDTLTKVANSIRTGFDQLSGVGDSKRMTAVLSLLREFNNVLTDMVNDFLRNTLDLAGDIDDFVDDYPNLPSFVLRKLGTDGAQQLITFERGLIKWFKDPWFVSMVDHVGLLVESKEGVKEGYVPYFYSVTLFPLDREALKIPVGKAKFILSHREIYLFNALKGLFQKQTSDNPFAEHFVHRHILVTKDGVKYRIGKTMDKDELFLVKI